MTEVVSKMEPLSGTVCKVSGVRECFGQKLCPNGLSKVRWQLRCSMDCRDEFILRKLKTGWSPSRIMPEVRDMWPTYSSFLILCVIGNIAEGNGYHFGWKTVERAIREGGLYDALDPQTEIASIREVFGVYGREGYRRASHMPVELPEGGIIDEVECSEGGQ